MEPPINPSTLTADEDESIYGDDMIEEIEDDDEEMFEDDDDEEFAIEEGYVPHPYGVKPQGNYYFDSFKDDFTNTRYNGLGLFSGFEDHMILDWMDLLTPKELSVMAQVSKAFYLFVQEEEQWKLLTIRDFAKTFKYSHSWQYTYKCAATAGNVDGKTIVVPSPLKVEYFYSDYLFHIWRCSSIDVERWVEGETIDRRSNMTIGQFRQEYLIPNKPVILTDAMDAWKAKEWTRESLAEFSGDTPFYINSGVFMTMKEYFAYAAQTTEENPMYLFDHYYGENRPEMLDMYSQEKYFDEDFFNVLGDKRPSYRWLLAGPKRSGATFHKDPNHTSAWNGVITGRKKWVMYPPHVVPPGVHPSDDGLEVTTPHSIVEWFINYYDTDVKSVLNQDKKDRRQQQQQQLLSINGPNKKVERLNKNSKKNRIGGGSNRVGPQQKSKQQQQTESTTTIDGSDYKPLECILNPGELIFVPCGWWHCVLNMEESIAITHNFINSNNILKVIDFMATKKSKDLHNTFIQKFEDAHPGKLQQIKNEQIERELKKKKVSIWDKIDPNNNNDIEKESKIENNNNNNNNSNSDTTTTPTPKKTGGFSFNFSISSD
ncbi:transcription factor jumonji [Cavenderia fasciculata]|uniref:Transcription factor jumonji n=1 Tax=Cavenderia fasciculata TaxID=261658 RepID=F4QAI2_CACFS|nr:transcription factor jumonji [Cavenderia fasciculata]EGG15701.1 transcription factor jumonji [Cavenderia fasciculata]|eukprot:XP_004354443.1 transcription factor jumonji [Cavenderia fasciculata]